MSKKCSAIIVEHFFDIDTARKFDALQGLYGFPHLSVFRLETGQRSLEKANTVTILYP